MAGTGRHRHRKRPLVVGAIIQRGDGCVLICRPEGPDDQRRWEFPGGLARNDETPEAALRRLVVERAGIHVHIDVGHPPLTGSYAGQDAEFRFFECGPASAQDETAGYAECRWVAKGQLCEYQFDPPTDAVAAWLAQ